MPTIEFVNHACVIIDTGHERILTDPWLGGTAFDHGWSLVAETGRTINDLDFSHIWISHEHPDHFSPRDLKALSPERIASTPLFYQQTPDGKVAAFCRGLGFEVGEIAPGSTVDLSSRTRLTSDVVSGYDSWLLVQTAGGSVLNLNDCHLWETAALRALAERTGPVDILLSQFGYASWVGNDDDEAAARRAGDIALGKMARQIGILRPQAFIPFASFVRCCHAENEYWNRHAVKLADALAKCAGLPVLTVAMFPGDVWTPGDAPPAAAAARWQEAYSAAERRAPIRTGPVAIDRLQADYEVMREKVKAANDWEAIEKLSAGGHLPPTVVHVTDIGVALSIDLLTGLREVNVAPEECDVRLGSAALANVIRHNWGRGTLTVNGRFRANYRTLWRFLRQTQIPYANNIGWRFPDQLTPEMLIAPNSFIHQLLADLAAQADRTAGPNSRAGLVG